MIGIANPFNEHFDAFRIAHVQRYYGWIETTWNNMSTASACRRGVVVCLVR